MAYNFYNQENIGSFSIYENDIKLFNHNSFYLNDYPKDLVSESLGNDFLSDIEQENSYLKNQIFNIFNQIEIPVNLTDKKITSIATNICTSPLYFSNENIKNKLKELNDSSFNVYINKFEKFKEDPKLKEMEDELNLLNKKRKKYGENVGKNNNKPKLKKGRKKAEDKAQRNHSKTSPDNIIKKIKKYFLEFLLVFVNSIIDKEKNGLKFLDYKTNVDKIKKDEDLKLLETTVKDYFYQDISKKYIKTPVDWNKKLIDSILKEKKDNEVVNFVFYMKIKDWLDLFTLKKSINDFEKLSNFGIQEIQQKIQINQLIKKVFNEILDKNKDDFYFTKFVFYLYNYENWFRNKNGRTREKKFKYN